MSEKAVVVVDHNSLTTESDFDNCEFEFKNATLASTIHLLLMQNLRIL